MTRILLGIIAALVLLLSYVAWKEHRTNRKLAEARVELSAANASLKASQEAIARDGRIAAELATWRNQSAASFRQFDETLRTSKVTREIRYVTQAGEAVVCTQRDPAEYRRLYNLATDPDSGTR